MGNKPEATAAKRKARRETRRRQREQGTSPARASAQIDHASGPAARRQAREGEKAMARERAGRVADIPPGVPEEDIGWLEAGPPGEDAAGL